MELLKYKAAFWFSSVFSFYCAFSVFRAACFQFVLLWHCPGSTAVLSFCNIPSVFVGFSQNISYNWVEATYMLCPTSWIVAKWICNPFCLCKSCAKWDNWLLQGQIWIVVTMAAPRHARFLSGKLIVLSLKEEV